MMWRRRWGGGLLGGVFDVVGWWAGGEVGS